MNDNYIPNFKIWHGACVVLGGLSLYFFIMVREGTDNIDTMVVPIVDDHMPHTAEKPYKN